MSMAETIKRKLTEHLHPQSVRVIDQSHKHAGHASAPVGGESHFHVDIVSKVFKDLDRINRQRLVYQILNEELSESVHALELATMTPDEVVTNPFNNNDHERKKT